MGEWHNMDAGCISSLDQFLFLHFLMASCGRCCDGCQVIAAVGSSRLPLRRCAGKATLTADHVTDKIIFGVLFSQLANLFLGEWPAPHGIRPQFG